MKPLRLLFETQQAAHEFAFMLSCEYDGCTMITLPDMYDTIALKTAIELAGVDFCFDGDHQEREGLGGDADAPGFRHG